MADCTVYIDEAGDLGINRGTKWFVLTGVIVDKKDEPEIRTRMAAIKTRLNLHEIHLRKTSDFMKRAVIVRDLAEMPFTYMNTYGIKYFVNDMRPNMEELRALRVCTKKERIPGATTT